MFRKVCCLLLMYRRVSWIMLTSLVCTLLVAAYITRRGALELDERYITFASDLAGDLDERVGSIFGFGINGDKNCTIFTLWKYKHVPLFVQLNLASWRFHSNRRCEVIKITDANVLKYIPDMPKEYFRIPSLAAQSDAIRYAAIYHHGGLYMDTDMLALRSIEPIINLLGRYEFIGYESGRQACVNGSFTSNFMGGRRGSRFHKAVWEAQKIALNTKCAHQVFGNPYDRACCPKKQTLACNVPWSSLGELVSWPAAAWALSQWPKPRMYCFGFNESFSPNRLAIVFKQRMTLDSATKYWKKHKIVRPLERQMIHLFNQMSPWNRYDNLSSLFDPKTVVGDLYIRSFGGMEQAKALLESMDTP